MTSQPIRRTAANGKSSHPEISAPMPVSAASTAAQSAAAELLPHAPQYSLRGSLPNTPLAVSFISSVLGGLACASLALATVHIWKQLGSDEWNWARSRLGVYGFAMGVFHLAEFWTTAGWNPQKLSVDAFLLNNTNQYHYAHAFGLTEYFISSYFFPGKFDTFISDWRYLLIVGWVLLLSQLLRSFAMIHANASFSHVVKTAKHDDHVLITHGVYAWSRHPSYAGFFYWAVATQLLLGNIVSTLAFIVILGKFFSNRIRHEEVHLVRFFGNDYVEYRKRVGHCLPFWIGIVKPRAQQSKTQ